jgi:hypothetical protein
MNLDQWPNSVLTRTHRHQLLPCVLAPLSRSLALLNLPRIFTHTPASLAGAKAAVIMLGVVADIFEEING